MDGEAVTDLILRAVAAMRERDELPKVDDPKFTVTRVAGASPPTYRSNVGAAIAAAQRGRRRRSPHDLAQAIADYLCEVVDLVPAYHMVATITAGDDGAITVTLRPPTMESGSQQ